MKMRFTVWLFALLVVLFEGCSFDDEESYTIWTDMGTYSEFQSAFDTTLNDGMYVRLEFTSSQWSQIKSSLTSDGKHSWGKSKIKDWLIGRGFGDYEAKQESSWLTTIEHGFIASRTGNTVYYILK